MIEDHQSEMDDDDLRRDDQYKQVIWSGVSHINMCEGIGVDITKNVREREMRMDGREEGREVRELSWENIPFGKEVSLLLLRK